MCLKNAQELSLPFLTFSASRVPESLRKRIVVDFQRGDLKQYYLSYKLLLENDKEQIVRDVL